MDFNDSPEEAAYRAEARRWLDANAPAGGVAPGDLAGAKAWQARKAAAGYAGITWSKAWGGQGADPGKGVIFAEEEAARLPNATFPFIIGMGMCLPVVMSFGDAATRERFGQPGLR